jgi:uncharacterized protein YjbJ (UPF0337 family)
LDGSVNNIDPAADWRIAEMGLQLRLGVLSQRRGWARALNHYHFAAARIHLDAVAVEAVGCLQTSVTTGTCDCPAGTSGAFPLLPLSAIEHVNGGSEMNTDQMKGNWKQLVGKAKEKWGKLTDNDWTVVEGQRDQLVGRIQERYGIARKEAERQVADFEKTHERI